MNTNTELQQATLAGGCFWCLEAVYQRVKGVSSVVSGYTGGNRPNPSYQQVCTGLTGHAEAVQISFDPVVISYTDLLNIFFTIHDPTTPDRQGADVGTQYRSAIFYHTPDQQVQAQAVIADLNARQIWPAPIVTELLPLGPFYPAEDYHQNYFATHPDQIYCKFIIAPKVAKFRKEYSHLFVD